MQFGLYPQVPALAPADLLMIHQQVSGSEKLITALNAANFIAQNGSQLTISGLRAKDVTSVVTGTESTVGGYYTLGDGGGGPFYYDSSSTLPDNGGDVIAPNSGVGRWLRPNGNRFNVKEFGALGNGSHDDTLAIQSAINRVQFLAVGTVYIPAGTYKISQSLTLSNNPACNISIVGDGPNTSIILQTTASVNGIDFNFQNDGILQSYRLTIIGIGLQATVNAGIGIRVSYGNPTTTNSLYNEGVLIDNVAIASNSSGSWLEGIDIESAWNCHISNSFISGNAFGSNFLLLQGSGIRFRRACVNSHIASCQISFFFTGIYASAMGGATNNPNTEGLFCVNNSIVACRRGVWLQGNVNASPNPRLPGFQMTGGMLDLRQCIQAINLEGCNEASINGVLILQGTVGTGAAGVLLSTCDDITVVGCNFFAMDLGVVCQSTCTNINVSNNVFRGGGTQITFQDGCVGCISADNIVQGAPRQELNNSTVAGKTNQNKVYYGNDYGFSIGMASNQSVADSTDVAVTWGPTTAAITRDDLDFNLPGAYRFWDPAFPSFIKVPPGVNWVRLKAGVRWDTNSSGVRIAKIRGNDNPSTLNINYAADTRGGANFTDCTLSTPVIDVKGAGIVRFELIVNQTSGGALNLRSVEGSFIEMEIIG